MLEKAIPVLHRWREADQPFYKTIGNSHTTCTESADILASMNIPIKMDFQGKLVNGVFCGVNQALSDLGNISSELDLLSGALVSSLDINTFKVVCFNLLINLKCNYSILRWPHCVTKFC